MILAVGLATSLLVVKGNQDTRNRAAGFDYTIGSGERNIVENRVVTGGVNMVNHKSIVSVMSDFWIGLTPNKKTVVCDPSAGGCRGAGENEKGMFEDYIECEKFCSDPRWKCTDTGCIVDQNGAYKSFDECSGNCWYNNDPEQSELRVQY